MGSKLNLFIGFLAILLTISTLHGLENEVDFGTSKQLESDKARPVIREKRVISNNLLFLKILFKKVYFQVFAIDQKSFQEENDRNRNYHHGHNNNINYSLGKQLSLHHNFLESLFFIINQAACLQWNPGGYGQWSIL